MKVLKVNTETNKRELVPYPRTDLKPAIGLDANIDYYGIVEGEKPTINHNTHYLKIVEVFSDEPYQEMTHIKTYMKKYESHQLSNGQIINNLNNSLGNHLDSGFPLWKQIKYLKELANGITPERKAEIQPYFDWQNRCRAERDLRENELINNNELPSFDWEVL